MYKLYVKNKNTYNQIKNKEKIYEIRLNKGSIKNLIKNQIIEIKYRNIGNINVKIIEITKYNDIKEIILTTPINKIKPNISKKKLIEYYYNLYPNYHGNQWIKLELKIL